MDVEREQRRVDGEVDDVARGSDRAELRELDPVRRAAERAEAASVKALVREEVSLAPFATVEG